MPLKSLLKNKLLIQKHNNVNEMALDCWPFWMLEENISIINEMVEEEEKERKNQEDEQQHSMPNFNPGQYMNQMKNMTSGFKK